MNEITKVLETVKTIHFIGIGGSATNDGGSGMLSALGASKAYTLIKICLSKLKAIIKIPMLA